MYLANNWTFPKTSVFPSAPSQVFHVNEPAPNVGAVKVTKKALAYAPKLGKKAHDIKTRGGFHTKLHRPTELISMKFSMKIKCTPHGKGKIEHDIFTA